jgi:prolyl-tRNA synthetase
MQQELLDAAKQRREANTIRNVTKAQFLEFMEGPGGFAYGGFCGDAACEAEIKEQTKATIRVLPDPEFQSPNPPTTCMWCGGPSVAEAVWAKAY